eukprot:g38204.t1
MKWYGERLTYRYYHRELFNRITFILPPLKTVFLLQNLKTCSRGTVGFTYLDLLVHLVIFLRACLCILFSTYAGHWILLISEDWIVQEKNPRNPSRTGITQRMGRHVESMLSLMLWLLHGRDPSKLNYQPSAFLREWVVTCLEKKHFDLSFLR